MNEDYIFDACALIAYLADEEGAGKVNNLLLNAADNQINLYMHKIYLLEVYYGIYREEGKEDADKIINDVLNLPIKVITTLNKKIFEEAGRIKANYNLSLADSIFLACATVKKLTPVTSDHHEFDYFNSSENINIYWIR